MAAFRLRNRVFFVYFYIFCLLGHTLFAFTVRNSTYDYTDDKEVFTLPGGKIRILGVNDHFMYIGARNQLLSAPFKSVRSTTQLVHWPLEDRSKCPRHSNMSCENYILFSRRTGPSALQVCGTYGYQTRCQNFAQSSTNNWEAVGKPKSGRDIVPEDPDYSHVFHADEERLFVASRTSMGHPFLVMHNLSGKRVVGTPSGSHLVFYGANNVNFHRFLPFKDRQYVVFTEIGLEMLNQNSIWTKEPTRPSYTRIARVCRADSGFLLPTYDKPFFTSYFKARLVCSQPVTNSNQRAPPTPGSAGGEAMHYDRLLALSPLSGQSSGLTGEKDSFLGVFASNYAGIKVLAVCAFTMADVESVFDSSNFLSREKADDGVQYWSVLHREKASNLTQCPGSPQYYRMAEKSPMLVDPVGAWSGRPIHTFSVDQSVTAVAVEWNANRNPKRSPADSADLLYLGTDQGTVHKILLRPNAPAHRIESLRVFKDNSPVRSLVIRPVEKNLIVVTDDAIRSVPLHRCRERKTCRECIGSRDPYCFWDPITKNCNTDSLRYNNIATGVHDVCKNKAAAPSIQNPAFQANNAEPDILTCEEGLAPGGWIGIIIFVLIVGLLGGTVVGWLGHRRWRRGHRFLPIRRSSRRTPPTPDKLNNKLGQPAQRTRAENEYQDLPGLTEPVLSKEDNQSPSVTTPPGQGRWKNFFRLPSTTSDTNLV